ncbi:hypothetical protein [Caryophanon latum]|uniref:Uncharacterized protein n=1 Tax=Caryophanon latum TaxID=33977 RepID=A0A1C0YR95_9BACL|nr:hypothetical protein [Caryophanon latum]OCS89694.1 hypothetical protein A6K76_12265 [Caryophanon latum]
MDHLMTEVFENNMGLYIVNSSDTHLQLAITNYTHYYMLLRRPEQDNLHVYALLNDFWHFFYYEKITLIVEPTNALYYSVRTTILNIFTSNVNIQKASVSTNGKLEQSLLAAIELTNLCIDLYKRLILEDEAHATYASLSRQFQSVDPKILFTKRFKEDDDMHPRRFTEMQSYLVKLAVRSASDWEIPLQLLIKNTLQRIKAIQYAKATISY